MHPVYAGGQLRRCDLRAGATAADYLAIIDAYATAHPDLEWITGGGWSMDAFPGGLPSREPLDAVTGGRPAFFPNRDGHGAWVNTAALRLAGIDASTPDPADGRIERDAGGEPTGALQEGAANLVSRLLPETTDEDMDAGARRPPRTTCCPWASPAGRTPSSAATRASGTTCPPTCGPPRPGRLLANVVGALWWDRDRGLDQLPDLLRRRESGQAGRFRATSVKMMLDGVAETHTAAMLEPYLDADGCATGHTGLDFIDPAELPRFVTALDAEGFQVHFHALGRPGGAQRPGRDRGGADRERRRRPAASPGAHPGRAPRRHPPVRRPVGDGQHAGPVGHARAADGRADDPVPGGAPGRLAVPLPLPAGRGSAGCAAGSDWSVSSPNPLWAAHVAVNRAAPAGAAPARTTSDPFLPEQALDLPSFLAAYTSGSARVNGLEDVTGSVRTGLDADFAVVDADLSHLPAAEIGTAAVTATWVRGQAVYQAA